MGGWRFAWEGELKRNNQGSCGGGGTTLGRSFQVLLWTVFNFRSKSGTPELSVLPVVELRFKSSH